MSGDHDRATGTEDCRTPTGINIAVGALLVIGATLLAAALFPPVDLPGRLLVVAIAVGGFAAVVPDLRAVAAVTVLGALTFIGFLVNQFGELVDTSTSAWAYTAVIGFAAALGTGYRHMRSSVPAPGPSPSPAPTVVPRPLPSTTQPVVAPPDGPAGLHRAA
ncbi:hypothetical protein [Micromonospora sp. WMMD812]|uniref:hypothetical protein n=1 Tax=Micromonospora sp. WMMD812 TaxID=3015152 RepID=UPI00248CDCC2|nr:hypothetical protein [Micromonospora sp. WMMD812]WBB65253.1 hypothetical protein O7603_18755 [Micromonospora sp. WMMD812]